MVTIYKELKNFGSLSAVTFDKIEAEANKEDRSVNKQIAYLLKKALDK